MRKRIVLILGLCLILSSFVNVVGAAEKVLKAEDVIKIIKEMPKTSVYTEVEGTSESTKITIKYWDDTKNGNYKSEEVHGKNTIYTVSTKGKTIVYEKGSSMAIEYNTPVKFVAAHDKEFNLKKLIDTTEVTYKGKEKVNGRLTYHLYGKGKKIQVQNLAKKRDIAKSDKKAENITISYPDLELWFDVETGIVIKSKMNDYKMIIHEINITKVIVSPDFSKDTFSLKLPSGVQVKKNEDLEEK
jgi:outer membrane lipoprotein-sorting protein